ncbi:MAG: hypothetical protein EHM93_06480 [Bacteroidales bacterium]|nr:MAG: hypothetical protein EHM93_06480 [Bacteroidales bacterium]
MKWSIVFYCIIIINFLNSKELPAQEIDMGKDKYICKNSNGIVIEPKEGEADECCYTWSPDDGSLSNIKIRNPIAKPKKTTKYTLTVVGKDFKYTKKGKITVFVVDECCGENNSVVEPTDKIKVKYLPAQGKTSGLTPKPSDIECTACLDEERQRWFLRVAEYIAYGDIVIFEIPNRPYSRATPNTPATTNIDNNNRPSNVNYWGFVVNELDMYDRPNYPVGYNPNWFSTRISETHELQHRKEWIEISKDVWQILGTEALVENISIDAAEAIKAKKAKENMINTSEFKNTRRDYYLRVAKEMEIRVTVHDKHGLGGEAYRLGRQVVDEYINMIRQYAIQKGWLTP